MCMIWNIPTGDDDDGNSACKPVNGAPKNDVKVDIVETPEMSARAAEIADALRQCETAEELNEAVDTYKKEINTKMSKDLIAWLKGEREEVKQMLEGIEKEKK